MNLNFIRSIMTGLAGVIPLIVVFFGCKSDAITGAMSCVDSWVPPQYAVVLAGVLGVISFLLKMFGQGGTVGENLASPSVAVTPEAKVGTVTPAQVSAVKK